jgi:hypothetical protein
MKHILFIIIGIMTLHSCIIEYSGKIFYVFKNNSQHTIQLYHMKNGEGTLNERNITLLPQQVDTFLYIYESHLYKDYRQDLSLTDSIRVYFDADKYAVHSLRPTPDSSYIYLDSDRSLYKLNAYKYNLMQKKRYSEATYNYTFEEQDYLNIRR